jgi:hypothetical protein
MISEVSGGSYSSKPFRPNFMEFVLTAEGWIRVKWDVNAAQVLRAMGSTFQEFGTSFHATARDMDILAERIRNLG